MALDNEGKVTVRATIEQVVGTRIAQNYHLGRYAAPSSWRDLHNIFGETCLGRATHRLREQVWRNSGMR